MKCQRLIGNVRAPWIAKNYALPASRRKSSEML